MSESPSKPGTTHFGYEQIPVGDKAGRIKGVFDSVAPRYDLMNDLMSLGIHRIWKRVTAELAAVRAGDRVLDLAAGTGDLTELLHRRVGDRGLVISSDINEKMLKLGRDRALDRGIAGGLLHVIADAERLPFADNSFHCATIAFGLRNVTDKDAALASFHRVLKPGGKLLVLEFSQPRFAPLNRLYDAWSTRVLPRLGKLVVNDEQSYRYLAESIRVHPDQQTLQAMIEQAGFECCKYLNLSSGIVALHSGYKT